MEDLLFKIALTLIPLVGSVNGKNLVAYCGGVKEIFTEKKRVLLKIPGIGEQIVNEIIHHRNVFDRAEQEVDFIMRNNIRPLFYLDPDYPVRLKHCSDGPLILYTKGNSDFNNSHVIAFVGTRKSTEYGRDICSSLISGLADTNALIVSGLAYGIDTWSHKSALENKLQTTAVLGNSLDRIYPYANKALAERMVQMGGLVSEFISGTKPDYMNFPKRNRIIAGMADAVVVVEAGAKGGALITADIANSYNRDVFAVPGRVGDAHSEGCNNLIKRNIAALIQTADDIKYMLNWTDSKAKPKPAQRELFIELSREEKRIVDSLKEQGDMDIDTLLFNTRLLPAQAATALLNLEFEGILRCLPGKVYKLI